MSEKTCATCRHSHTSNVGLECRAMPPAVGEGRLGRWPGVRPADFCHGCYRPAEDEPPAPATTGSRARRAQPQPQPDAELPL